MKINGWTEPYLIQELSKARSACSYFEHRKSPTILVGKMTFDLLLNMRPTVTLVAWLSKG
ncbi:MAG: hypothetical protein ACOYOF_04810 [Verrucomicrobiaceae bacterium]